MRRGKLKVLLNGLGIENEGAGISNYAMNLIKELAISQENSVMFSTLLRKNLRNKSNQYNQYNNLRQVNIKNAYTKILYEQTILSAMSGKWDVIHCMDFAVPLLSKNRTIATIHDLAMYDMVGGYTRKQILYKQWMFEKSINKADKLVCISEYTKSQLIKRFPNVQNKAVVIYPGLRTVSNEDSSKEIILSKYNLKEKKYLLFIGTLSPHKNLVRLIDSFEILKTKNNFSEYKLMICGKLGWMFEDIIGKITCSKYTNDIVHNGYISEVEKNVLIRSASLMVNPSLHEGFGFPPLEALSQGVNVVVSDIPSFREICDDSAYYFDPNNTVEMASVIESALLDKVGCLEKTKSADTKISFFTWKRTANEIVNVYNTLL